MKKIAALLLLCSFSLTLVSWQSYKGIRIEKRRYRKGYYVHVWKTGKTDPAHTGIAVQSGGGGTNSGAERNVDGTGANSSFADNPPPVSVESGDRVQQQSAPPPSTAIEPTRAIQQINPPKLIPKN